ncbi:Zinc finger, RING/FYVE/PHD-type [Niveomyces insectorum RCEF 264]|uniref:Zinc finger, RING/FYVE/PHD-type n=1 Tax=Niveomyces insectorum RCEF 264 TaxID=1081102 RepID=A0A167UQL1_9HYPO|nr:Zinc finger, RING/FYVE/PHD-type [Niveomyces insectorum RCEF 264]
MDSSMSSEPRGPSPGPDEAAVKSCFICLQTQAETPGEKWATPCPCTLDVHEKCMLQWIAENEVSKGTAKKVRCPACNSRIHMVEPWDPVVSISDRYNILYRRASPFFLLSIFATMGVTGSSYYGFQSMLVFAGPSKTLTWLGIYRAVASAPRLSMLRWRDGVALFWKLFLLNLVAPCLLLQRAFPSLANLIALPASFVYGATLISRRKLPSWPPSPAWALVAMPYISLAYSTAYYDCFGALEDRLNRALRARSETGPEPANGPMPDNEHAGPDPANDPAGENPERGGIGATLRRIGNVLANALHHQDDIVIENVGAAAAFGDGEDVAIQLEIVMGDAGEPQDDEEIVEADGPVDGEARLPPNMLGFGPDGDGQAPDADQGNQAGDNNANGPDADGNDNGNGNGNANEPAVDANRGVMMFSDVLVAMTTQLLLPRIAAMCGQLLGGVVPRSWVTRPDAKRPGGLLQERWGRSLVGGCVFIVLRDAWRLYTKYRRVQVKQHRKIKNVDRRKKRASGDGTVSNS